MIRHVANQPEWLCHLQAAIVDGVRVPVYARPAGMSDIPLDAREVITTISGRPRRNSPYVYDVVYQVFAPGKRNGGRNILKYTTIGRIESDEYIPALNAGRPSSRNRIASGPLEGKLITLACGQQRRVHIDSKGLPLPLPPEVYARLFAP